jgi:hypothetical protein
MNRRLRFYGSVLSLLAFSAYSAESVWAAMCDPAMEPGMDHMAMAHGSAHANMPMPGDAPVEAETPPDPRGDAAPCPIAAGGAGGCVSLTLIADGVTSKFTGPESSLRTPTTADPGDLLIATSPFHPPRV